MTTGGKPPAGNPEPIIELVEQVTWYWLLIALGLGIAAGIAIVALIGREREAD